MQWMCEVNSTDVKHCCACRVNICSIGGNEDWGRKGVIETSLSLVLVLLFSPLSKRYECTYSLNLHIIIYRFGILFHVACENHLMFLRFIVLYIKSSYIKHIL